MRAFKSWLTNSEFSPAVILFEKSKIKKNTNSLGEKSKRGSRARGRKGEFEWATKQEKQVGWCVEVKL